MTGVTCQETIKNCIKELNQLNRLSPMTLKMIAIKI